MKILFFSGEGQYFYLNSKTKNFHVNIEGQDCPFRLLLSLFLYINMYNPAAAVSGHVVSTEQSHLL